MLKDYDKRSDGEKEIPINSPEYLKRFQRSFNPMYIPKDSPVIMGSMPKAAKGVILTSAFSSNFRSSMYLSSRKLGSGFGSGSAMFSGLGYGIELI